MTGDDFVAASTFSGVGGLDLGLARAGFSHAFFAEADPWRRDVLAAHWPGTTVHDDVRAVDSSAADKWIASEQQRAGAPAGRRREPSIDLLAGGFPCQDLSVAGKRAGLAGARSGLFHEFARIADAIRPRWILLENVPGLLSSNDGRDMGTVVGTLADLGFGVAWRVLDARYFGVPQRRRRVFIVGRAGGDDASALRALCESCVRSAPASRSTWQDATGGARGGARGDIANAIVTDAREADTFRQVSTLQGGGGSRGHRIDVEAAVGGQLVVSPAVTAKWAKGTGGPAGDETQNLTLAFSITPEGGQGADLRAVEVDTAPALGAVTQGNGTDRGVRIVTAAAFSENQRGEVLETPYARQLTTGGGKPGQGYPAVRISNTLKGQRGKDGGGLGADETLIPGPAAVRRLTPVECERLMSWPDGWTAPAGVNASDSRRYAACGDGVVANVAEWIARRIIAEDTA